MNISFFLTLAGMSVSVAGFAALMSAFGTGELSRVGGWRIRMIVTLAFRAAIVSLSVVAIDALVDDENLAIQIASVALLIMLVHPLWASLGDRDIYASKGTAIRGFVAAVALQTVPVVANLFFASPGLLMVIYLIVLGAPMSVFVAFINERSIRRQRRPSSLDGIRHVETTVRVLWPTSFVAGPLTYGVWCCSFQRAGQTPDA